MEELPGNSWLVDVSEGQTDRLGVEIGSPGRIRVRIDVSSFVYILAGWLQAISGRKMKVGECRFPVATRSRSRREEQTQAYRGGDRWVADSQPGCGSVPDRKSTRLNSSH